MKQVHWLAQILTVYYINMELQPPVSVSNNMEDWSSKSKTQIYDKKIKKKLQPSSQLATDVKM